MSDVILLDAGPLGLVSHPRPELEVVRWLARLADGRPRVIIPEIADYEVRRELLRSGKSKSIQRLNQLKDVFGYLPITTEAMLKAAEFWAEIRKLGRPTAADHALDADVILAGQASSLENTNVVIASTNVRHLSRFVTTVEWRDIVRE